MARSFHLSPGRAVAVATAGMLAGLLVVLPLHRADAAASVPAQTQSVITLLHQPLLPGHLVISNGRATLVRHTDYGILANEYGFNPSTDPDVLFKREPLPMGAAPDADLTVPGPLPRDVRYAEVFSANVDGEVDTWVAVVGRRLVRPSVPDEEATDWTLAVAGPLRDGMPVVDVVNLGVGPGAHGVPRGLAVVGEVPGSAPTEAGLPLVVVNHGDLLRVFRQQSRTSFGQVNQLSAPAGARFEHITHRALWDNPSDLTARTFKAGMERSFLALLREPDDQHAGRDSLRPRVLSVDTSTGVNEGKVVDVTPGESQYNKLRDVAPNSRAVLAYDYSTPDWCCAGEGGGSHQGTVLNGVRDFSPVVAIAPDAGGPVTTHWFHPPDTRLVKGALGVNFGIPANGSISQTVKGACGNAAPGETPALDVNATQMAYDTTNVADFSTDLIDVACAVRESNGLLAVVQQTWFTSGPILTAPLLQNSAVAPHSTVDVVQVHGCAQLNRTHQAFLDAALASGSSTVNGSPFNIQPGADPANTLAQGGQEEKLNCSMGTPTRKVYPNQVPLAPVGSYPGSVTPLTVATSTAGTAMRARSIPNRITAHVLVDNAPSTLTMTNAGSTAAPRVPVGEATSGGALIAALPPMTNDITVQLDKLEADLVELTPQPVALLAAPPTVHGAGQEQVQDPPEFATSTNTGAGAGTMKSQANAYSLGIKAEDPLFGSASAEVKTTWESTSTSSASVDATVTIGDLYYGSVEEDTMVYNSTQAWRWTGTILSSSLGIGVGTEMSVEQPKRTVMTTQSVDQLARQYPEVFGHTQNGSPGIWTAQIEAALGHTVGDPGSYLHYDKTSGDTHVLDDYCDGSVAGEQVARLTGANPFVKNPPDIVPDVLISNTHHVQVGSGGSEGAFFEVEESTTSETVSESSVSVEVSAEAGFGGKVTAGASSTHGWGTSYSTTLGEGTGFSSAVGNIPHVLPDEEYDWNMFMCRRTLLPGLQVYVLNYTTDGYDGTGGLEELGEIEAEAPADASGAVPLEPTLSWIQEQGTVKEYTWELQSFLAPTSDRREGTYVPPGGAWSTPKQSQARRDPDLPASVAVVGSGDQPLLANTDYRWRVTATDFVDGSTTSEWFYFKTAGARGAPDADFSYTPADPEAGSPVDFTDASDLSGAFTADHAWAFDDGSVATDASPSHTFAQPGQYDVLLEVTTTGGTDQVLRRLHVAPRVVGDVYEYEEGVPLVRAAGQGLLVNDLAGNAPDVTVTDQPDRGHVGVDDDGAFTFTPAAGDCADHTFTYQVVAAHRARTATVRLAGVCRPVAAGTSVTPDPVVRDGTVHISASAVADPGRILAAATVRVDGGPAIALTATDGTFDETTEQVSGSVELTGLATGDADLCVAVTDSGGLDSAPDCTSVTITPKAPVADLEATPAAPIVGEQVTFADRSDRDGLPGTYLWDFGDGATASGAAPVHTFAHAGDHVVSLTVSTSAGTDTASRTITVGRGSQTIVITSPVPADVDVGGTVELLATGGNSGNPVVFAVAAASAGVCSLSGTTLSFDAAGLCTVETDQGGDADYEPAPTVTVSVQVSALPTTTTVRVTPDAVIAHVDSGVPGIVPTGQVGFTLDGVDVAVRTLAPVAGGGAEATLRRRLRSGVRHQVMATYLGEPRLLGSVDTVKRTDPRMRARVNARGGMKRGWYRRPVLIRFSCHAGTGVLAGACPDTIRRARNGAGQVVRRTLWASDGGKAKVNISGLNIDRVKPKVKALGVRNRGVYRTKRVIRCLATDRHSGIHSCHVYTIRHRRLNGDLVVRYRVRATDVAGNKAAVFGSYLVRKAK